MFFLILLIFSNGIKVLLNKKKKIVELNISNIKTCDINNEFDRYTKNTQL